MSTLHQTIQQIKERAEKATAGPVAWQKFGNEYCLTGQYGMRPIILSSSKKVGLCARDPKHDLLIPLTPEHPDAMFYAASRTDVPALCRALEIAVKSLEAQGAKGRAYPEANEATDALAQIEAAFK